MTRIHSIIATLILCLTGLSGSAGTATTLKLIETTDVHGALFPYDLIEMRPVNGSLARIHNYVARQRETFGDDKVILLDNGDLLQGQPTVYYYNYIDTLSPHIANRIMDFMGYDAATVGNHDIETGHAVYDRFIRNAGIPMLGANVLDTSASVPYLQPYAVIERDGLRIAILGMVTPGIPSWLPENLWSGLEFADMQQTAMEWVPKIIEKEHPDLLVGLFHSGRDSSKSVGKAVENASMEIARTVPGFDVIFMGHDHRPYLEMIDGPDGRSCIVLNGGSSGRCVAEVEVDFQTDSKTGKSTITAYRPAIRSMDNESVSTEFTDRFAEQFDTVKNFVSRRIATMDHDLVSRDAYFGPSEFMSLLHSLQLEISGADISFSAPLGFDTVIQKGPVTVSDMFKLYKYENLLYTMRMTGTEIKDYLELAYDKWTDTIAPGVTSGVLRLNPVTTGDTDRTHSGFVHPSYNFDSAAGIIYTVDVTKPAGEKIRIISMQDGSPFSPDKTYLVAVNSYRGNGGGDLMTKGAGITAEELAGRIVSSTDRDLRFYLMQSLEKMGTVNPVLNANWKFIPEDLAEKCLAADRLTLFPDEQPNTIEQQ